MRRSSSINATLSERGRVRRVAMTRRRWDRSLTGSSERRSAAAWRPASGSTMWRPRSAARATSYGGEPVRRDPAARRRRSPLRLSVAEREEIIEGLLGRGVPARIAARSRPGTLDRVPRGQRPTAAGVAIGRSGPRTGRRRSRPPPATCQARPQSAPAPGGRAAPARSAGRPSRSPADCATIIPTSRRCGCPTRRSTSRCSCRAGVRCGPS